MQPELDLLMPSVFDDQTNVVALRKLHASDDIS
jgi:hypothetical protein